MTKIQIISCEICDMTSTRVSSLNRQKKSKNHINSEILYDLTLKIVRNYPQNIDNQESRCAIQEVIFYGRDLNK